MADRCMRRDASDETRMKEATGISVFLLEELGDARLRCLQLKKYIDEAVQLIEDSEKRDHFFEVAAHLIHGIPECLMKMEKALDTAAMAAARLDYEEIKDDLRPEKVEQLERALEDVRIRHVKRRSGEDPRKDQETMNAKTAAEQLLQIAETTESTGQVPFDQVFSLIASLEQGRNKSASIAQEKSFVSKFRGAAAVLEKDIAQGRRPSSLRLASYLRKICADSMAPTSAQMAANIYQQSSSREEVMKGFKDSNPSMSQEDLEKAADAWERNKNVVKDKS